MSGNVETTFTIDRKFFKEQNWLNSSIAKVVGAFGVREIKQNFRVGGRPNRWKPSKRAQKGGGQTLIKTGRLRNSITYKVESDGIRIGTNVKYAAIHNSGGVINHPGGTPYAVIGEQGKAKTVFMKKDGQYPPNTKFTKPHKITIPKREFMNIEFQPLMDKMETIYERFINA